MAMTILMIQDFGNISVAVVEGGCVFMDESKFTIVKSTVNAGWWVVRVQANTLPELWENIQEYTDSQENVARVNFAQYEEIGAPLPEWRDNHWSVNIVILTTN